MPETSVKPRAILRRSPDDFVVTEVPLYEPSGEGEHLFLTIRKRSLTAADAITKICAALGVDARSAGHAGMKDLSLPKTRPSQNS